MEENFSLSLSGAEIHKKMPFESHPELGISQLNLLKSDLIGSNSLSFSEHIIKRDDFPRNLYLSHRDDLTPKASFNLQTHMSDQYSLDKELLGLAETHKITNSEHSKAQYSLSDKPEPTIYNDNPRVTISYINILQRYELINRAINALKNRTKFRKFPAKTTIALNFLKDSSVFLKKNHNFLKISSYLDSNLLPYKPFQRFIVKINDFFQIIYRFFSEILMKNVIKFIRNLSLDKYHPMKLFFEIVRLFIVIYFFFEFSLEISLQLNTRILHSNIVKIVIILTLFFEFIMNPGFLSAENPIEMVKNLKKSQYKRVFQKILGFFGILCYFILPNTTISLVLNLFILFYCEECKETADFWSLALKRSEFMKKFLDFITILSRFFIFLHLLTFIAIFSGFFEENEGFLAKKEAGSIIEAYFYCVLAIFRLFFTEINNNNHNIKEFLRNFLLLLLWLLIFLDILKGFLSKFLHFKKKIREFHQINRFLKENNSAFSLEISLKKLLKSYKNGEITEDLSQAIDMINSLKKPLKKEIFKKLGILDLTRYSKVFERFSEKTLNKLKGKLKYRLVKPGEFLFRQGDLGPSLFLVIEGVVELSFANRKNNRPCLMFDNAQKRQCLSEFELLTASPRRFSAQSKSFSSVFELSREDFLEILCGSPSDYEAFSMIYDQISLYSDLSPLFSHCSCCFSRLHTLDSCSFLHFIPNRSFLIEKHIYNCLQKRAKFLRKMPKRRNSLFFSAQNRYFALQINNDNKEKYPEEEVFYQESSLYPSDYSLESEDDFSEEDFKNIAVSSQKFKSTNTLPSIKREKIDSLEVIDEESKSRSNTVLVNNNKSCNEIGFFPTVFSSGPQEEKFGTKLLETKNFDTKRQISATELKEFKPDSKIMTEGGKLFEDYLKRNSLLSKQSSIGKAANTTFLSEFVQKGNIIANNPHYKNTNVVLSLTEGKITNNKAKNSVIPTVNTNTATKSNKSSKTPKNGVFDLFMDFESLRSFQTYFPKNNCESVVEKIRENGNKTEKSGKIKENNKEEDRFFFKNTIDSKKKSHFGKFGKKKTVKTSLGKISGV